MATGSTVFPIRPARAWYVASRFLTAVAAAAALAWTAVWLRLDDAAWPVFAILVWLPVVWALTGRPEAPGRMSLGEAVWCFEPGGSGSGGVIGEIAVMLDLGDLMLLRFRPDDTRWPQRWRWFALSRSDMPADWQAFRRAVYSPRLPPAGLSAQAPADPPA